MRTVTRRRFLAGLAASAAAPSMLRPTRPARARQQGDEGSPEPAASPVRHYEYVFPDGGIYVYDIDDGHRLVKHVDLPQLAVVSGAVASPVTRALYLSYGNTGSSGSMLRYDLVADRVLWERSYPVGTDSMAITPDGRTIYLPVGGSSSGDAWRVVDAEAGDVLAEMAVARQPHNTICGPGGDRVYLGAIGSPYLHVASTASNTVVGRVGPLGGGVRPFTIDGRETLAYVNVNGLLGFEVADLATGRKLHRVSPAGFPWQEDPGVCPSHGVALSPDETEVWVIDQPHNRVHVYDVRGVPGSPPRQVADIALAGALTGRETSGLEKEGWLGFSRDGRFAYVGDAGDVIEAATRRTVLQLPALADTRKFLQIDFRDGVPIFATPRYAIGYVGR